MSVVKRPQISVGKCILWFIWSFNLEASLLGVCCLRVPFIFRHIKCLGTSTMAQGAPFESVFREALGKGDQAGPNCVDGLHAQLKDNKTVHVDIRWRASGNL